MPLTMARSGHTGAIKGITGKDDTKRYLESLGFIAGESITVVSEINGGMILSVKGARVALGKDMARRIII